LDWGASMLKFGIIGLGDIALKAYLPIYSSTEKVEFHLYTRNQEKLASIGGRYRFEQLHQTMESMIDSGIKAAFVHTATESHEEIIYQLLTHDIHVYVDKPISYDYQTSKKLIELADQKNLILMTGFNRRYAPAYQMLKELDEPNMIIMQKNRKALPDSIRTFVLDDFIHVVDTVRYHLPNPIKEITINGKKKDNLLYHVVVQFISEGTTALAIMNRDSGTNEEILEVMNSLEKRTVYNVAELTVKKNRNETNVGTSDWESTLYKRGFQQIVDDFIDAVSAGKAPKITNQDGLLTHEICEQIVWELESINE
jgi:virulence factor